MNEKMHSEPLVSVIIPCYCQEAYLSRAFASLDRQTYNNFEVIVVDDGSPNPVTLPVGDWRFKVTLLRQDNAGLSGARNTGLQCAKGEYIKFLDADDELLPDCLELQTRSIAGAEKVLSVIGYVEQNEDTGEKRNVIPAFGDLCQALLQVNLGPPHCYLYPSALIKETGEFHIGERTEGGHEDYDFVMRLCAIAEYAVTIHTLGVIYYKRQGTMSSHSDSMHKTRVSVWSENAIPLLNKASAEQVGERLLAALSGWVKLSKITPDEYAAQLGATASLIVQWLDEKREAFSLPEAEFTNMCERLASIDNDAAVKLLNALHQVETKPGGVLITSQEVIDRRFGLSDLFAAVNEDWYLNAFAMLSGLQGKYAIYGAGELGEKLGRHLKAYGNPPALFVDRNAAEAQRLHDIPVVTAADERLNEVTAVFIASKAYYKEMKATVEACLPNVEILGVAGPGSY